MRVFETYRNMNKNNLKNNNNNSDNPLISLRIDRGKTDSARFKLREVRRLIFLSQKYVPKQLLISNKVPALNCLHSKRRLRRRRRRRRRRRTVHYKAFFILTMWKINWTHFHLRFHFAYTNELNLFFFFRTQTHIRDETSLPSRDELVYFLLQSSNSDFPKCANCDRNEKNPMFYCTTCGKWKNPFLFSNDSKLN